MRGVCTSKKTGTTGTGTLRGICFISKKQYINEIQHSQKSCTSIPYRQKAHKTAYFSSKSIK